MTTPRDVARDDQRIALGRDIGRTDPRTAVFTLVRLPSPEPCCWCDCSTADLATTHAIPGYVCGSGCGKPAGEVVYGFQGTPQEMRFPICEPHRGDFFEFMGEMIRLPVDVVTAYPDEDAS